MTEVLIVGLGGFFGAIIRYCLSKKFNDKKDWPLGTLSVNLAGSFVVGVIVGLPLPRIWLFFLVSGFAGALTTFSTLQKEVIEQWRDGKRKAAIWYMSVTCVGGILLAGVGYFMMQ